MVQRYAASFLYGFYFILLKWQSSSFRLHQNPNFLSTILMAQMICSQIQQAPGPDPRKVGKSLLIDRLMGRRIN